MIITYNVVVRLVRVCGAQKKKKIMMEHSYVIVCDRSLLVCIYMLLVCLIVCIRMYSNVFVCYLFVTGNTGVVF